MSQVLVRENPPYLSKLKHPFLEELSEQIRRADVYNRYYNWSDESLINQLIVPPNKKLVSPTNLDIDFLSQLLTSAFYKAIGATIERITVHPTETYTHLQDKECSSAVICCGGVLVLYSLIWGSRRLSFCSLQELIESAENSIQNAVIKASRYLDF